MLENGGVLQCVKTGTNLFECWIMKLNFNKFEVEH